MAAPAPDMAAYTPMARLRGGPSGNVVAMRASAVGAAMAPPIPWTTRAAMSQASLVASPPRSEAPVKMPSPTMNMRRRPKRSPVRPPSSSSPPKASV